MPFMLEPLNDKQIGPIFGQVTLMGRSPECGLVLGQEAVSRYHCRIEKLEEGYILEDLDSKNGTLINNVPIKKKPLANNDIITLGQFSMLFKELKDSSANISLEPEAVLAPATL